VDVGFNAQLKKHVRNKHHEWCIEKYKGLPNASKIPTPDRESFVEWVKYGFSKISSESLIKTFKYIGYWTGEQSTSTNNLNIDINPQLAIEAVVEDDDKLESDLKDTVLDNITFDDGGDSVITRDIMLLPKHRVWAVMNEKDVPKPVDIYNTTAYVENAPIDFTLPSVGDINNFTIDISDLAGKELLNDGQVNDY
jgi:hypothetical protein